MMLPTGSSQNLPAPSRLKVVGGSPLMLGQNISSTLAMNDTSVISPLDISRRHSNPYPSSLKQRHAQNDLFTHEVVGHKSFNDASFAAANMQSLPALKENDSMVYLEGPRVYSCAHCRTHLTNSDEIISKSFHGRSGRAFLFDHCVNVTVGKAQDRVLMTGLHSVCDISCKRCKTLIGWTYARAYESSQKYKEGKFIVEKINLYQEDGASGRDRHHPRGQRSKRSHGRFAGDNAIPRFFDARSSEDTDRKPPPGTNPSQKRSVRIQV
jgi:hypothetical protein